MQSIISGLHEVQVATCQAEAWLWVERYDSLNSKLCFGFQWATFDRQAASEFREGNYTGANIPAGQ